MTDTEASDDLICEHCKIVFFAKEELDDLGFIPEHWYCSEMCFNEERIQ